MTDNVKEIKGISRRNFLKMGPPLSRSGVNHRLRRISEAAARLREEEARRHSTGEVEDESGS